MHPGSRRPPAVAASFTQLVLYTAGGPVSSALDLKDSSLAFVLARSLKTGVIMESFVHNF